MPSSAGTKAAIDIAKTAGVGSAIGLGFAVIWKVGVMDYYKNGIDKYYANAKK
eukprot:CAMPEP_0182427800 /NCGR_PEP_ID=MMETSP1167-20130531/19808_1 /TAXON_ID=2988 /ORGANISM="Mallomonas Sp, Strain CCMP3275" /LENGTH=52 /DNA_ID=CAMNT_0024610295 /DNA_START=75 /DNA_END=233 /DNA_ORIENTATION=-